MDQENLKKLIYQREKDLSQKNITAKQEFQQAEAEYQVAQTETMTTRQQLVNYGLTNEEIELVKAERQNTATLKVRAPFSGSLIEKHAVTGEAIDAGEAIFQLANLSTMWLDLSIPESQLSVIQYGDTVQSSFSAWPTEVFNGIVTWISPQIDEKTRMIKARVEIPNLDHRLKQGLFGQVRILKSNNQEQWIVPSDAVQQVDGKSFLFVKTQDDLFELRHVVLGNKANQQIEIVEGLTLEDEIVIASSFVLKSEFLKSRFGAGCTHD
jgi:cobalt-zinc-cadmium efflux system membrane fusion protein